MAKLIQKLPSLVATAREVGTPKLQTFWRYAKVSKIKRNSSQPCIRIHVLLFTLKELFLFELKKKTIL